MYARTNAGGAHGDFQDRNGVNYVSPAESFGHCSQLFWKKDPSDSGPSSTISWCDQLPSSSASLSGSSLSMDSRATSATTAASAAAADMDSDERPYACDLCNCAYKHASSLLNHKLTHRTGDFRCDFCSKPYTNYMSLRNHMRIHGQKRYVCDLCGKAFRLARYLRNHQKIHDDGPNRFDCPSCCKSYRTMLELAQHRCSAASSQPGNRRANFSSAPRRQQQQQQQQQQNNTTSMMQQQHGGHTQQEPLPPHCVSPMTQGGGVAGQPTSDPHQGHSNSASSQSQGSQQSMRNSSSSNKHVSSSSSSSASSYSLLQPLVPEVKEMGSAYTRLTASSNPMPKHQDSFSLAPQRPLTTINPIGHTLHPNGAPTLKPSPVPRTIQGMPWEQRSLYNQ
ncbi:zinc finger protein 646-like [Lampris incognitus]|uniref:zinc finger protein 646-like n=1 Tax=Lampris incognitus TaxID=2546036 RepID=UPI0024B4DF8B|nr:zinc finger protein 646-like [Lampris incognitus]